MGKKKKENKPYISPRVKLFLIILLIPVAITVYFFVFLAWQGLRELPMFEDKVEETDLQRIQANFDLEIPVEYIPIYIKAGEKYNVPWTLLAAHHRIETRFSTMKTLISPVGAEGHMQFMPCTFVGWKHPTCSGLGEGDISETDKTNPAIIKKYGGYGVDANEDGVADPFQIEDAIYSAANFLSIAGASQGEIKKAVYQYNHSEEYVEDILYYYELYKKYKDDIESIVVATKL
ncbi:lytic transglycosylase domain-containing protein [Lysinibacillus sp. 54212]|uniref:lytic transglycosylase domain-containing protein n=1 Tax=Lysinibacillus sp. 54212 TaxID=3119829 RepID=UPI002FC89682